MVELSCLKKVKCSRARGLRPFPQNLFLVTRVLVSRSWYPLPSPSEKPRRFVTIPLESFALRFSSYILNRRDNYRFRIIRRNDSKYLHRRRITARDHRWLIFRLFERIRVRFSFFEQRGKMDHRRKSSCTIDRIKIYCTQSR